MMEPEIRELPERTAHCVTRTGLIDGTFAAASFESFTILDTFINNQGLEDAVTECIGICPDEATSTAPEDARFQAGVVFDRAVESDGEVEAVTLPAGRWAVFTHKGPYETLSESWNAAYGKWLPASGEQLRDTPPYERYVVDPGTAKTPEDLVTEIHIPVQ